MILALLADGIPCWARYKPRVSRVLMQNICQPGGFCIISPGCNGKRLNIVKNKSKIGPGLNTGSCSWLTILEQKLP